MADNFGVVAAQRQGAPDVSLCMRMEMLTAFLELESAIRSEIRARGERRLKLQT
jgi:hypothetical protein